MKEFNLKTTEVPKLQLLFGIISLFIILLLSVALIGKVLNSQYQEQFLLEYIKGWISFLWFKETCIAIKWYGLPFDETIFYFNFFFATHTKRRKIISLRPAKLWQEQFCVVKLQGSKFLFLLWTNFFKAVIEILWHKWSADQYVWNTYLKS
jgi:hypothetical protein